MWFIVRRRKWAEKAQPQDGKLQSTRRKFSKALDVGLNCLFLFGAGLLTDNVTLHAHSLLVRLEPLPSVLMALTSVLGLFTKKINKSPLFLISFYP